MLSVSAESIGVLETVSAYISEKQHPKWCKLIPFWDGQPPETSQLRTLCSHRRVMGRQSCKVLYRRLVNRQAYSKLLTSHHRETNLVKLVTTVRNSRRPIAIIRHIPDEWHCCQNLKDLPKYKTSHPRGITLPSESHGPTQSTWRHTPEEWHCHQNLTALPKYMTSHPRRVTLPPEPQGPTKVHDVTPQKSDTATRTSGPYQSTWRHTPEEWHSRQNLKALPKYMTSHPRRVTLPPEPQGPCLPTKLTL